MASKAKHIERSRRSYSNKQYAFSGFRQFDKRENVSSKTSLIAMFMKGLFGGFKKKTKIRNKGDK